MYARSTTFQGKPENIDAGIKFVKTEAAPVMDRDRRLPRALAAGRSTDR